MGLTLAAQSLSLATPGQVETSRNRSSGSRMESKGGVENCCLASCQSIAIAMTQSASASSHRRAAGRVSNPGMRLPLVPSSALF